MSSRSVRRARLQVEALEPRWMPATLVSPIQLTYQDIDGDPVRVTFSKPILTSLTVANDIFTFNNGDVDNSNVAQQQLWEIDLTGMPGAANTDITVELDLGMPGGTDTRANVGFINASGLQLGKVNVRGDLGRILVGNGALPTPALKKLRVGSLGVQGRSTQAPGGNLDTVITGAVGKFIVNENVQDAYVKLLSAATSGLDRLSIGVSLIGGNDASSGRFDISGPIGTLDIGGNVVGGSGGVTGAIFANEGIDKLTIAGSVLGGAGSTSGFIRAGGKIKEASIGGDILASTTAGEFSGTLAANKIDSLLIGGSLRGGPSVASGRISVGREIGALTIGGSLLGGAGPLSGRVESRDGSLGDVTIGGLIFGGSLSARTTIGNILVGDSIVGAANGRVTITAGGAQDSKPASIASLTVNGSVEFADILSGYSSTSVRTNADASIGPVKVGIHWIASNLVAGVDRGADGYFGTADDGFAVAGSSTFISRIGPITIGGVADGTTSPGDSFGIVAELVKALSINGVPQTLTSGPSNDMNVPLPTNHNTNDFFLKELEA